ncbi:MAG: molybdate ABC transporter substrate-binding protein [Desulfuromonadaceae bacterium]|nr:molybdate ABC transporter substrate-binding protein [Desulfuromonadaceae bacterium]
MKKLIFTIYLILLPYCAHANDIAIGAGVGLKDVLNELSASYSVKNPEVTITKSYLASGALAKQMDNGLKVDVVFVANLEWMEYMKSKKHVDASTVGAFAYNTLVFAGIPRHADKGSIQGMQDIARLDKIALGSPKFVPAGDYAMHAIRKAGIEKALEKKLVMARDVRDCMMYADRGEVDGAFVYRTDAMMAQNAKILFSVPTDLYPRVVYMMAVTTTGAKRDEIMTFYNFLKSIEAKNILKKHGFEVQ